MYVEGLARISRRFERFMVIATTGEALAEMY